MRASVRSCVYCGLVLTSAQLDSKVPTLVANKPLGGVMLKETEARRKALSNPIVGSQ